MDVVFDCIDNFDGCESLIVICVDLDAELNDNDSAEAKITRSKIYRAVTGAQLMTVIVNKYVKDGWLSFILRLEFKEGKLNADLERAKRGRCQQDVSEEHASRRER